MLFGKEMNLFGGAIGAFQEGAKPLSRHRREKTHTLFIPAKKKKLNLKVL